MTVIDSLLRDAKTEVIICCGTGGVGKTTTSAALAVRAAEAGRKVCLITIDPAARLGQAMGIENLGNSPQPVLGLSGTGALDAMMLDAKSTFDELILRSTSAAAAERILSNNFYQQISQSLSGTQEYMAMEKLTQLRSDNVGRWDLIIVDTPPSRSALDFLDAPARLERFVNSRLLRTLTSSGSGIAKLMSLGLTAFTQVLGRILGGTVLQDLREFSVAFDSVMASFTKRTTTTFDSLSQPSTSFLIVASPHREPLNEADFFVDRLTAESMRLAAVIINRMSPAVLPLPTVADVPLSESTAAVLATYSTLIQERVQQEVELHTHKKLTAWPLVLVPDLGFPVQELSALRQLGEALSLSE